MADMGEDESNKIEDELLEIYCCATTRIGKGEESNSEEGEKTIQRGKRWTTIVSVRQKRFGLRNFKFLLITYAFLVWA